MILTSYCSFFKKKGWGEICSTQKRTVAGADCSVSPRRFLGEHFFSEKTNPRTVLTNQALTRPSSRTVQYTIKLHTRNILHLYENNRPASVRISPLPNLTNPIVCVILGLAVWEFAHTAGEARNLRDSLTSHRATHHVPKEPTRN